MQLLHPLTDLLSLCQEFEHNVDLLLSKIYWNWASNRYLLVR
jgi:hypothetical protein